MAANTFCHIVIATRDTKKASEFYKSLFGWKLSNEMGDDYIFFHPESGPGGAFSLDKEFTPSNAVVLYIEVEDIEASLKKTVELGGERLKEKTEIPNIGWYGMFKDLDGNTMGVYSEK